MSVIQGEKSHLTLVAVWNPDPQTAAFEICKYVQFFGPQLYSLWDCSPGNLEVSLW